MASILKSQITYLKSIYWGCCTQPFLAKFCLSSSSELWKRKVQTFLCCSKTHLSVKSGKFFLIFILDYFQKINMIFSCPIFSGHREHLDCHCLHRILHCGRYFFYLFSLLFFLDQTFCVLPPFFQTVPENGHKTLNSETNTLCFQLWMNKAGEKFKGFNQKEIQTHEAIS